MTKQELRQLLRERRAAISADEKKTHDRAIVSRIAKSKEFQRASAILLYAPMPGEINLLPLAHLARKAGKPVAFPRCNTADNTIEFFVWEPDARLMPGAYGIPEPPANAARLIPDARALCILPGLSFAPNGARLGYGKGYYDRFLEGFPGVAVGAVYERMILKELPCEAHDKPVSLLFTEAAVLHCATGKRVVSDLQQSNLLSRAKAVAKKLNKRTRGEKSTAVVALEENSEEPKSLTAIPLHEPPILVGVIYGLLLLSRALTPHFTTRDNETLVLILAQLLLFLLPAAVYLKRKGKDFLSRLRLRPPRVDHIWFLLFMPIVMITGGMLCEILTGGIASLEGNFTIYDSFSANMSNLPKILLSILAYALLPALCEEFVFRAILCAEYERYGAPIAIVAGALFFAMLHFSLSLFPAYLFLGILLAGAMYVTRSFFAAFLLHLVYNLFCLFGQPYLSAFYVNAGSNEIFLFCLIVLFLLFGAFATGEARKIYHRYARANLDSSHTPNVSLREQPRVLVRALFSPAVAICIVVWLIVAILNLLGIS
ncbi:MAG: 5-formyltetrahydrofolate cyclo-ligase [Clostridia bacterium]|nr:5-formyltetrahydrofolate cyclo-ligase [Clostridia bacterium]